MEISRYNIKQQKTAGWWEAWWMVILNTFWSSKLKSM